MNEKTHLPGRKLISVKKWWWGSLWFNTAQRRLGAEKGHSILLGREVRGKLPQAGDIGHRPREWSLHRHRMGRLAQAKAYSVPTHKSTCSKPWWGPVHIHSALTSLFSLFPLSFIHMHLRSSTWGLALDPHTGQVQVPSASGDGRWRMNSLASLPSVAATLVHV